MSISTRLNRLEELERRTASAASSGGVKRLYAHLAAIGDRLEGADIEGGWLARASNAEIIAACLKHGPNTPADVLHRIHELAEGDTPLARLAKHTLEVSK